MIAMALACDPRILIADEPTTALDVTTQAQVLDLLRELQHDRGLSVILITHDMGVIAEMADDVAVMYLGRIVERGPVEQIFHAPRHPYTRALLRSIPSTLAKPRSGCRRSRDRFRIPTIGRKAARFIRVARDRIAGRATATSPHRAHGARSDVACFLYQAGLARLSGAQRRHDAGMTNILEVENLKKHFPIRRGLLRKVVGQVKAVDGVSCAFARVRHCRWSANWVAARRPSHAASCARCSRHPAPCVSGSVTAR